VSDDDEIEALRARLAAGPPSDYQAEQPQRIPKPIYNLNMDDADLDERSIILIIRTGKDGVVRAMISLPQWYEIAEMWDGPHDVADAIRLADDYADAYCYYGIAIDIESSQLWDPAWGKLVK
jgi:hypothetical protein